MGVGVSFKRRFGAAAMALLFAATSAQAQESAAPFAASRDGGSNSRALQCLTQAIYFEARSESDDGQRAVAQVVLNRVRHPRYPASVCGVVYQGSERRTGCQFTFTCDGSMNAAVEPNAWARASRIAQAALQGYVYRPVGLALNYHTTAIRPYWAPSLIPQITIGAHIFYRQPGAGSNAAFRQARAAYEPDGGVTIRYADEGAVSVGRSNSRYTYASARVEMPVVERPVIERAAYPRAGASASRRNTAAAQPRGTAPATATPRPRAPRMTIENGVRVFRGS